MKKKSSAFKSFFLKAIIITGCIMYAFSANAQSITGKWKLTSAKESITDKATGQKQDLTPQVKDVVKMMEEIIEFHRDNTYFTSNTMIGNKKGFEATGTYTVSGNQIKLEPGKSNVPVSNTKSSNPMDNTKLPPIMTIVSQSGNTLVLHYGAETKAAGKNMVVDIEDTFQKQ